MTAPRPRSLGVDPATGKEAFAVTCPGGVLEALADAHALQSAAALAAIVGAVLQADNASDAELAALVPPLHAALDDCIGMMAAGRA
ncbi:MULTISPECIES: hypothetical protein [Streptomyces]|uniref:Uncharacterized protein n=1 Tax=Streptomyces spinosisporus TaxID=2927582 RepID=A0ABS9XGN8_9ACTN|nr:MULTISPECIES: hypothetical protein [Streptomyces]EPD56975.1 hypothetical protein HMPREF1211_06704 [Streptomyces sp. HGB0020]MCI3241245.1 hypothetical protein [Streptomyces spinosisporus]